MKEEPFKYSKTERWRTTKRELILLIQFALGKNKNKEATQ